MTAINHLEQTVVAELGTSLNDIKSLRDSLSKGLVVYFLLNRFNLPKREIAESYKINYLYVANFAQKIKVLHLDLIQKIEAKL